jgi:hypothetical protein
MYARRPFTIISIGIVMAIAAASHPAFAISADLAKRCRDMAIKAHPFNVAGSKTGTATAQRSYFNDCIAKDGNMPDSQEDSGANGNLQAAPTNGSK